MATKKSAKKTTRPVATKKQDKPVAQKSVKTAKPVAKAAPKKVIAAPPAKTKITQAALDKHAKKVNVDPMETRQPKAKKEPTQPPKPVAHMKKDLMSGMYFFELEDVRCPIDNEDLARTLGAGQWGYGRGMVDQWSSEVWQKILAVLDLPTEPFVRDVAAPPVKRFVQSVWLKAFNGRVLEESKELFESRDKAAIVNYEKNLEQAKVNVEEKRERAVTNLVNNPRTPSAEKIYQPTEALKDKKLTFTGQPLLIIECFRKAKFASTTCKQLAEALTSAGLKTAQPAERVAMHYLNLWRGKGWLEVTNG